MTIPGEMEPTVSQRLRDERGASLVEYALLVGLIAMVALLSVTFFGEATSGNISRSASHIVSATED